jgi:pimeloyl-ACP methyl ester carboxylesterase
MTFIRSFIIALFAAGPFVLAPIITVSAEDHVIYKKGYVDGRYGQIHYHSARPAEGSSDKTPVVFFHQNPKSAEEYRPLLEIVGQDRLTLAFDTPGYGESDRPDVATDMAGLTGAMEDALVAMGYGANGKGPVDVFGFHTGVYIAAELAITRPDLVRRVVMSGIAYYDADARAKRLAELPRDQKLPEDGTYIMNRWFLIVIKRAEGVSVERAAKVFLEDIHSLDKSWFAYNAVWSYALEERFPLIKQPVLVLQPHELLLDQTRKAKAELLPDADMIELPDIIDDVFDTGPREIAAALTTWLDATP